MLRSFARVAAIVVGTTLAPAHAAIFGGVEFPGGIASFADTVVSYAPVGGVTVPHQGAFNALGAPDYVSGSSCPSQAGCTFVSLGDGGVVVLRFTDNLLTGSDSNAFDLWIFEIGPDVEDTFVEVSVDGAVWSAVGKVTGGTRGIDLDAFGFGSAATFGYVRLTDDPNEGGNSGATAGADIDAVGAISSIPQRLLPEPGALALLLPALLALGLFTRRARRSPRH